MYLSVFYGREQLIKQVLRETDVQSIYYMIKISSTQLKKYDIVSKKFLGGVWNEKVYRICFSIRLDV